MSFKVFVMTSDKHMQALRPFAHQFNKHWSSQQQVIVVGYATPEFDLPDNFTYFSLGSQNLYPLNRWSDSLIRVLQMFPMEKVFCLMLEDYWLAQPVRLDVVRKLYDYMLQFQYVLKMDLCGDRRFAWGVTDYGYVDDIKLVKSHPESPYQSSLMVGFWNRDLMLKHLLIPDEGPHELELIGTPRLARLGDKVLVLGTEIDPWPVRHILAYRGLNIDKLLLDDLCAEDVAELREKGLI